MRVLSNGAKMETVATQNNRPMEWNVNFLLTTTIHVHDTLTITGYM